MVEIAGRNMKPSVIVLTEVWAYSHEASVYNIDGYTQYHTCQDNNAAGGVMVFIKDDIPSTQILNYKNNVDACAVERDIGGSSLYIVGAYRSPSAKVSNIEKFIDEDLNMLFSTVGARGDVYWLADSNIDIADSGGDAENYMNKLASLGLKRMETTETRITDTTETTIDHIFVRETHAIELEIQTLEMQKIADHKLLKLGLTYESHTTGTGKMKETERTNWLAVSEELSRAGFKKYLRMEDPEECIDTLIKEVGECRKHNTRGNTSNRYTTPIKPWITKNILRCMRTKDKLWEISKKFPNNAMLRDRFKKYRNTYIQLLRTAESNYLKNSINMTGDPKGAWRVINEQIRGKNV